MSIKGLPFGMLTNLKRTVMITNQRNSIAMCGNLFSNKASSNAYDVYLNKRAANTTYSVPSREQKSNTFTDTGKVIIGCKYSAAQRPLMDENAITLQVALLQDAENNKFDWCDKTLLAMLVAVCLYGAVSLCIWGAV